MKNIILTTSLIILAAFAVTAQNSVATKYRITAFKAGNTQITSTSNEVQTVPDMTIFIPNAFTPNNDGLNDVFGAVGEGIKDYHLIIYNRWGEKVFESNDVNNKWDGKYKGESVELGTYSYSLEAKSERQKNYHKSGTVTVVL